MSKTVAGSFGADKQGRGKGVQKGVNLSVNGKRYDGWKSVRVTIGIESIAGKFDLTVSDRWDGQSVPWPILEEDECELFLDDDSVIVGWVDKRSPGFDAHSHTLTVSGRDRPGALVDNSALLNDNGSSKAKKKAIYELSNVPLLTLAERLAAPFGISVALQIGSTPLPAPAKKLSIEPGDTCFDVLERACRLVGVLPVSDGAGGLLLMRPGSTRTHDALVQGQNLKAASANYDASGRYRRYLVHGSHPGSDNWLPKPGSPGPAAVSAEAEDANVRRESRVLLIRAENALTPEYAKSRAQWEASVRAARSAEVSATVVGWRQSNGVLWPPGALVPVKSSVLGIDQDMVISEVTFSADESGKLSNLSLKWPGAFKPEPVVEKASDPRVWSGNKAAPGVKK